MKKKLTEALSRRRGINLILRKMKLTILFSFLLFMTSWGTSLSQTTKLSLQLKNEPVQKLIQQIEDQTDFYFLYQDDVFHKKQKVTIQTNEASVESILRQMAEQASVNYQIIDRQIVLMPLGVTALPSVIKGQAVSQQQKTTITGKVTDSSGASLPGVSVVIKGTTTGVISDSNGNFTLQIPVDTKTLQFSFVGMKMLEEPISGRTTVNIVMEEETVGVDEVVVVGYGTQKKSDITGSVSSLNKSRLEMVPNINIAQAIQGSVPGIMVQQSSAGAAPSEVIMIRGRNSILADNTPLIIVDGIPYGGQIRDISPNDVESIEILKDASAAAIYGSRGSNGVILITTKNGALGKSVLSYDGYYSIQKYSDLPEILAGDEFYKFKQERFPGQISLSEQAIYDSGNWVNWLDLGLQKGSSQQHNLSVSGGFGDTKYFIAGSFLDVQGLALNDLYQRITSRVNVDTKIANFLTIGTRTQFSMDDRSGAGPSMGGLLWTNPLSTPYDENGNLAIYPWPEDLTVSNPLQGTLYNDIDKSYQVVSNNFAVLDIPYIKGLSYRINTGLRFRFTDASTYRGRNTASGLSNRSSTDIGRSISSNTVIENILSYNRTFGNHNIFATALYSYEGNNSSSNTLFASGFPHDFLTYFSAAQADLIRPEFSYNDTKLISQMLRLNYSFASRYLITITGRRDGFSGFGAERKWGLFPSVALGWNLAQDELLSLSDYFNVLKLRASWGVNGNQAVGAYESISRLNSEDMVDGKTTVAGYKPSRLGQDELGWESSQTLNIGIDFGISKNRLSGELNFYKTNTSDLLLARTISPVHGINSITQNIGKTENMGIEGLITTKNIDSPNFQWTTSANFAFVKNEIKSLYGILDENGNEVDDIVNAWFIGQPIRVIYDYVWEGTWQLDEAEEAAKWGTQPGFVKLKDSKKDGKLTAEDKEIIGQQDPNFLWGMTNSFSYKQFKLEVFIHGVHGVTKNTFPLNTDLETFSVIRRNTTKKDWWTPDNPTNDFVMNHLQAEYMAGIRGYKYDPASFIRLKDVSLSYDIQGTLIEKVGLSRVRLYMTGRNLFTHTKWRGFDPELSNVETVPLQKEYVLGLNIGF
jgi:TonB-linked SusC/RagA family outer membrane protein